MSAALAPPTPTVVRLDLIPPVTLGVISDTHVPDRASRLNPAVFTVFREAGVAHILHAGDISTPAVLDELRQAAPLSAVRGNRDWLLRGVIPLACILEVDGVQIGLAHGHGNMRHYVVDKLIYLLRGYSYERYARQVRAQFPAARAIVFGHIHRPVNRWTDGQLLFNPGPAGAPGEPGRAAPSVGLLRILPGGEITGEIVHLPKDNSRANIP